MKDAAPTSLCPRCGNTVIWTEQYPDRPFCSERCKLIDLGAWLTEAHRIPGEDEDADAVGERPDD